MLPEAVQGLCACGGLLGSPPSRVQAVASPVSLRCLGSPSAQWWLCPESPLTRPNRLSWSLLFVVYRIDDGKSILVG